jgi:hypothetical protein
MPAGIDGFAYRNSAALGAGYATPTWNEVGNIKDLEYSLTWESFETSVRREKGVKSYEPTMADLEITFMLRVPELAAAASNPDFDDLAVFVAAMATRGVIDMLVLNGSSTTVGARGFRGFFKVHDFSESQANADGIFKKITLKPSPVDSTTIATTATAEMMRHALVGAGPAVTFASWGSNTFA